MSNLILLCRSHHREVHGGMTVEPSEHSPVFRRRDGSVIQEFAAADRAPP